MHMYREWVTKYSEIYIAVYNYIIIPTIYSKCAYIIILTTVYYISIM